MLMQMLVSGFLHSSYLILHQTLYAVIFNYLTQEMHMIDCNIGVSMTYTMKNEITT